MGFVQGKTLIRKADAGGLEFSNDDGVTWTAAGTSPPASSASIAFARAQALLGISINRYGGTDFDTDADYKVVNAGTGTSVLSVVDKAGVLIMSSGASASGLTSIGPHGAPSIIDNPKATPWYLGSRAKLTTAPDAAAYLVPCGLASVAFASPAFAVGGIGFLSTGFFSMYAQDNGATTRVSGVSTVPLDTAYHYFEMWSDGATLFAAIDMAAPFVSAANTLVGTNPVMWALQAGNTTTAATQTQKIDLVFWATSGN